MTEQRNSEVEWLGIVPSHWTLIKLGHLLRERPCYGVLVPDYDPDGVEMLRINDMTGGPISRAALLTISPKLSGEYSRSVVQQGDVVLSVVGTIGEALEINSELAGLNLSRAVARIQTKEELSASFLVWCFRSPTFNHYIDLTCVGTAQRVLNMADLTAFLFGLPPLSEQQAIAAFLDRETAKIDALVAEQERLIALLAEKRRAVISHAVTKGLDPNAPMKDSGIAWLGEVPAHWEVSQMRRIVSHIEQGWSPLAEGRAAETSEKGVLKLSAVSGGLFWEEENKALGEELCGARALEVRAGDLLITRANTPALVGECCVVPQSVRSGLVLPDLIYRLSLAPTMDARFLCELLRSPVGRYQIKRDARGSSMSMAKIAQEHIKSWVLLKPPLNEQRAIVAHLDHHNRKLDALTDEAQRAIALLKERRAALISAAVTGKIDVRDTVDAEEVAA